MVKAVTLAFSEFSNSLLETFVPNLVSLTRSSLQILGKSQRYYRFPGFWSIPYKRNCHNSRTSDDIDMKLGPVTKPDKRTRTTSKKLDDDVMSENCDAIAISEA